MKQPKFSFIKWLNVFTWLYFTLIFAWAVAYFLLGDFSWWMFAANALSFYFFAPVPLVLLAAFLIRRRETWIATLLTFLLALFLYGRLFLPWKTASMPVGQSITVMTYNVLGDNEHADEVINVILAANADVISLQELNPVIAHAVRQKLFSKYPYQVLDPQKRYIGSGVVSRYPLYLLDEKLPGTWVGTPQILSLIVNGEAITILQAHAFATSIGTPEILETTIRERERQARTIRAFAQTHTGPLIVPTDFNSTSLNTSYRIVSSALSDAWMEAGWGLGNTFPHWAGLDFPTWAIRIDYIFYSHHFRAASVQVGGWDGYSDHRPMLARLVLQKP